MFAMPMMISTPVEGGSSVSWSFVSATNIAGGTLNATPSDPTNVQNGDIIILFATSKGTDLVFTIDGGDWGVLYEYANASSPFVNGGAWIHTYSGAMPDFTVANDIGDTICVGAVVFRGGTGPEATADHSDNVSSSTTVTFPSISPGVDKCLILTIGHTVFNGDSSDTPVLSGVGTFTERLDGGTGNGTDCGLVLWSAVQDTAGATGTDDITYSISGRHVGVTLAILPS